MKNYIGTKLVKAEPESREGKEGYKGIKGIFACNKKKEDDMRKYKTF